ncbi:LCP family protein required for cell wall assembly [Kitasatospora sp. GP30]|uniref:LCP family protein n=1 Tax=Kitasatospora sp. GP30 TaxID=3035084 RepID=UPI000C7120CC|nr:LCP family protein [Kitasatospora sp. GP30]MDH6138859.1 LCP family protein required for cell wall assembly [Kitasatospora sp. GP30]
MTDPEANPGEQHAQDGVETTSLSAEPSAAHPRRRRLAKVAVLTAAALVLGTAGAGFWFYERLDGNLSIFSSAGLSSHRPPDGPSGGAGNTPVNVLVLGSDSRADGNNALAGGDIGAGNSDTAILLHVYADHRHAVAVSIPRDALVDIPPCLLPGGKWTEPQHEQMFNSAFSVGSSPTGNPACSQNTVETMTGLRVHHTVVVDFKGFAAMTSAVGGVQVCVPNDVDGFGIHLKKGLQTVSGQSALDFVRARHGLGDGSDIGRMKRQQAFLASLIKKIQAKGFDLTALLPLADAATKSLTVDQGLGSPLKLASFIRSLRSIKLADVNFVTAPWQYAGERVALIHPDVDTLWTLLRQDRTLNDRAADRPGSTAAPTAGPSGDLTVPIVVQNGSPVPGLSPQVAQLLRARGYRDVGTDPNGIQRALTVVEYPAGKQAAAEQLARYFPGAQAVAGPSVTTLTVTVGADYAATLPSESGSPVADGDSPDATATDGPSGSQSTGSAAASTQGSTRAVAGASTGASPTGLPSGITQNIRPADTDPCSGLSYG